MKRILSFAIVAALIFIAASGCSKNNFGKWETRVLLAPSLAIPQERWDNIKNCIGEVEYFNEAQQYEGYRDDVLEQALNDFSDACRKIDEQKIDENLYYGEYVSLVLVMGAPGSGDAEMIGKVSIVGERTPEESGPEVE